MAADSGTRAAAWSVYDRAELRDTIAATRPDGRRETLLALEGMHCSGCVASVERGLAPLASDVRVNLAAGLVELAWDERRHPLSEILAALKRLGFTPTVLAQEPALRTQAADRRESLARLGVAALLSMQVMMLAWPGYFGNAPSEGAVAQLMRWAQWLLATPVVLYSGWPFFRNAARALARRALDMDVPVATALAIAYLASAARTLAGHGELYFDSATMFVFFLAGGRYLEGRTRALASRRLRALAGRQVLTAHRLSDAGVEEVPVAALARGHCLMVAPGEPLPVDGQLLDATAELDESLLTGESKPMARTLGERLLAGSINVGAAPLRVRAAQLGADTTLSQISRLLHRAQSQRPPFQLAVDRFAGAFIAAILLLAAAGAALAASRGFDPALSVALAVLVASCPCALSLAVPAATAAASTRLATAGALLARPEALARLPAVDTVIFDKTGTLTHAAPRIVSVRTLGDLDAQCCLAIAAALERGSAHPLARAFDGIVAPVPATDLRHERGTGVTGQVGGARYILGAPEGVAAGRSLDHMDGSADADGALTWIALAGERRLLALIGLGTTARSEAPAALLALRRRGCALELLTGDAAEAAAPVARSLGIDAVRARQTPGDKLARLQALQAEGRVVMAVGDGVNDAPFLAAADVAVAMPHGAALAQARADVILLGDSLAPLPLLLDTARRARRVMHQNLGWALAYNAVVLPLAMTGALAPWMAALGMSLSSLLVVGNALRLGVFGGPA